MNRENSPPLGEDDFFTVKEDEPNYFDVLKNDIDDFGYKFIHLEKVLTENGGTLSIENEQVKYTPSSDFYGEDSFEYRVFDGVNYSVPVEAVINVESVHDPMILVNDQIGMVPDQIVVINIIENDVAEGEYTIGFMMFLNLFQSNMLAMVMSR